MRSGSTNIETYFLICDVAGVFCFIVLYSLLTWNTLHAFFNYYTNTDDKEKFELISIPSNNQTAPLGISNSQNFKNPKPNP